MAQIGGDLVDTTVGHRHRPEEIAAERLTEVAVARGEPCLIGADAPIEGLGHGLDLTTDPEIPDSHLAQRTVEVREHDIEQPLREFGGWRDPPSSANETSVAHEGRP